MSDLWGLARSAGLCLLVLLSPLESTVSQPLSSGDFDIAVARHLRTRLEHTRPENPPRIGDESVHAMRVLPEYYDRTLYAPAWTRDSRPSDAALALVGVLGDSRHEGLEPEHYHLTEIERLLRRLESSPDPAEAADLDLLLTDAFLILGAHLVSGRVDPETFDPEWIAYRREVDLGDALARALARRDPRGVLEGLLPDHPGYRRLRAALATHRELEAEGGWPSVEGGAALEPGASGRRVAQLRRRLDVTEGTTASVGRPTDYDEALERTVRAFQERHGLGVDGIVGEKTLAALNTSAARRVAQIELNLERWRWLPQNLGGRYVLVNIPGFELAVVESEEVLLRMRVVVGQRYRRTPVFSDTIRYLVLNPYWEVPTSIAIQDKLPEILADPTFLGRQGYRVYSGWGGDQVEVDPATVDWQALGRGRFPYRLRQSPGPLNALGRVKFMFPNRFNVYLHDTPTRDTFQRSARDASSGCIRLESPLALAELLLEGSEWTKSRIDAAIASGRETVVNLYRPTPVHLEYWTAWVDPDGTVQFRDDLYGRDQLLLEALGR